MAALLGDLPEMITPSAADAQLAGESSRTLARILAAQKKSVHLRVQAEDAPEETIAIPLSALRLLSDVLTRDGEG